METVTALLALCEGNLPIIVGFPSQRTGNTGFEVLFDVTLNKQLNKQSIAHDLRPHDAYCDVTVMWCSFQRIDTTTTANVLSWCMPNLVKKKMIWEKKDVLIAYETFQMYILIVHTMAS